MLRELRRRKSSACVFGLDHVGWHEVGDNLFLCVKRLFECTIGIYLGGHAVDHLMQILLII